MIDAASDGRPSEADGRFGGGYGMVSSVASRPRPKPYPRGVGQLAGLDGLRGLAVAAVVVFHLDPDLVPGGFLGVDIFFVISGFLITQLLLSELTRTGRLSIRAFYRRRVRRLLPAALGLIAVVLVAGELIWTDERPILLPSVLASLANVSNWWLIFAHESYFVASGRPPLLQHLWSLSIEEQYYLVWPVVLVLVVRYLRARRPDVRPADAVFVVAIGAAAVSTLLMAVLALRDGIPYRADSGRVYFGTDTHASALLLGSAAGALRASGRLTRMLGHDRPEHDRVGPLGLLRRGGVDLAALAGLVVVAVVVRTVDEFRPALFRGGMTLFDLVVVVVVLAVSARDSSVGRALDAAPLRWVGRRSYSIYLWHWPVAVLTRPGVDVDGPVWLVDTFRLVLILVLAELSYRLLEHRFRSRAAPAPARRVEPKSEVVSSEHTGRIRTLPTRGWALAGVGAAVGLLLVAQISAPNPPPTASAAAVKGPTSRSSSSPRPAARSVSAFGDSVLLGASTRLHEWHDPVFIDAVEGVQAATVLDDVVSDYHRHRLHRTVVLHIGNNGIIDPSQLASTLRLLARDRVVLLTDRVPRDWQDPNNRTIEAAAGRFANVRLIDWHRIAGRHPAWLYSDGLHLTPSGAVAYSRLLATAAG